MAAISSSEGDVPLKEGVLHYKYDVPSSDTSSHRPTLLFFHAGVTDLNLWEDQVRFFVQRGWFCLRSDRFGFGLSKPSDEYLDRNPRPQIDHVDHVERLIHHVLPANQKVIVVGLSMGGGLALDVATFLPEFAVGLVVVAGGILDFGEDNLPEEEAMFEQVEDFLDAGDAESAARLQVRIWGDGTLQTPGRMAAPLAKRMLAWNLDIAQRQIAKTGGEIFNAIVRKAQLEKVKVPTLIAYGEFDETNTTTAMKRLAAGIPGSSITGFPTAHMVNLELGEDFNLWLDRWLMSTQFS